MNIPPNYLCPTVPNRLNYICWIKDVIDSVKNFPNDIIGIDVGVGACAIYPLLGHTAYNWKFIGNGVDIHMYEYICLENSNINCLLHILY